MFSSKFHSLSPFLITPGSPYYIIQSNSRSIDNFSTVKLLQIAGNLSSPDKGDAIEQHYLKKALLILRHPA